MNRFFSILMLLGLVAVAQSDTLIIQSHHQVDLTWYGDYDKEVVFPSENSFEKVLMDFTMGCASGGCSDWDYTVSVFLMRPTGLMDSVVLDLDTMLLEPLTIDTTWAVNESFEKFELARLITPYGAYMDAYISGDPNDLYDDSWTHSYIFDVTDFAPLLRDTSLIRVHYGGWSSGFSATVDFDFIVGVPPREVLHIENMYPVDEYSYRSLADDESFPPLTRTFEEPIQGLALKSYISGHKHAGPENCCEWVPKNHSLSINSQTVSQWSVWKDCGMNPIFPQGGTWPFDRAGWCPGSAVDLKVKELTNYINVDVPLTIDYSVEPYKNNGEDTGTFIVSNTLFSYGAINFEKDLEIIDILKPSRKDEWRRMNPMCAGPLIEIRNRGSEKVSSVKIQYGLKGEDLTIYDWTGDLEFLETAWIELPEPNWKGLNDASEFVVHLIYDEDEYLLNNTLTSDFDLTEVLPNEFIVSYKTQNNFDSSNRAAESSLEVFNSVGELVYDNFSFSESNTWYHDTLRLSSGCYSLVFRDLNQDGINEYWYSGEPYSAAGMLQIRNLEGVLLKIFPDDFGQQIDYQFTINPSLHTGVLDTIGLNLYPNPTKDFLHLNIFLGHPQNLEVSIINAKGYEVTRFQRTNFTVGNEFVDTKNMSPGIYYCSIFGDWGVTTKRFVVTD